MLVSHAHRFIYLKTFKTAGTSVELYFQPYCLPPGAASSDEGSVTAAGIVGRRGEGASKTAEWYNHMPAVGVRERLGEEIWQSYRKFCVVRDPFEKIVSDFWFNQPAAERARLKNAPIRRVRRAFTAFLRRPGFPLDRPICAIGEELAVDRVLRYERLQADLAALCDELGIPWQPERMQRAKGEFRIRPESAATYYSPAGRAQVAAAYAWERATFGYPDRPAGWSPWRATLRNLLR